MFTINDNGLELRNLEEQVKKNKEDIAKHYAVDRALSNLGIKVIGQVSTPDELPNPTMYQGKYGDTYAVGNKEEVDAGTSTYMYYVFTRPDPNASEYFNYWLNVGSISIVGPQGPEGPKGPKGETGEATKWYVTYDANFIPNTVKPGDFVLEISTGQVYQKEENELIPRLNIMGPQGIQGIQGPTGDRGERGLQGPKGETGDVGGFINIWGTLASTSQLPSPSSLGNLTVAYLVEHTGGDDLANDHYDLYIQVGSTSATAVWTNAGPFNAATLVTVNGIGQNVWDADTKADVSDLDAYIKTDDFNLENGEGAYSIQTSVGENSGKNSTRGKGSSSFGRYLDESGEYNLTQGYNNKVQGNNNAMFGYTNIIYGNTNLMAGYGNRIYISRDSSGKEYGSVNFVTGWNNKVYGDYNTVFGRDHTLGTSGQPWVSCILLGRGHDPKKSGQILFGTYSKAWGGVDFAVGNGKGPNSSQRSNAFDINSQARARSYPTADALAADPNDNDLLTRKEVNELIEQKINELLSK